MKVIRLRHGRLTAPQLAEVEDVICLGGVVAFPTETAYGLAADPTNAAAVKKIYRIKGRASDKRLPLVAGSVEQAHGWVRLGARLTALTRRHWPGPLTVVATLRRGRKIIGVDARHPTVAIRVPGAALARRLCLAVGHPLTSTSANLSGRPTLYAASSVKKEFAGRRTQPDLLIDAGRLVARPPSTIVSVERGRLRVLRAGAIRIRER